jgi:LytS/YehU family sensor histidine kinase
LVAENDAINTSKFITSFSELVRQTLDNAPELFIPLNDEIKFLTNYFELERIKLEDRFSYSIQTIGIKNTDQLFVPNMVIQPFVENAIKHGIRYKKDRKGFIEVNFEKKEAFLRCSITDNGVGREKAAQMKKDLGITHRPKGMNIAMKRIESLNILTRGKTCIEIEDLKSESQDAMGTRVIIDFYKTDLHDKNSNN